jgi:hypothetical protein
MSQNRSSAVMQQRSEPHDSLDDFPTPPWATRALCERLQNEWDEVVGGQKGRETTGLLTVREPAANRGHMVRPLSEYFAKVEASDINDYGAGYAVEDYLFGPPPSMVDWTISNPPFRLAEQFIARALETSRAGVAMIVRAAFLEGAGRYRSLFSVTPPTDVWQFTERVVMHKGTLSANGSTATAYCWLVWQRSGPGGPWSGRGRTVFDWIAPCRKRLERAEDYTAFPT